METGPYEPQPGPTKTKKQALSSTPARPRTERHERA